MPRTFREYHDRRLAEAYMPRQRAVAYVLGRLGITSGTDIDPGGRDRDQFEAWMSNRVAGYKDKLAAMSSDPALRPVLSSNPRLADILGGRDPDATVNDLVNAMADPIGQTDPDTPAPNPTPDPDDGVRSDDDGPGMGRDIDSAEIGEPL